jgi:hypothetical protein
MGDQVPDHVQLPHHVQFRRETVERFRRWKADHTTAVEWFAWGIYWRLTVGVAAVLGLVAMYSAIGDAPSIKADQERAQLRDASIARLDHDIDVLCIRIAAMRSPREIRPVTTSVPTTLVANPFADAAPETCSTVESTHQ